MVDLYALRFDMGATWLNLLVSLGHAYGTGSYERITGPDRVREFLTHEGLTPATSTFTDDDVTRTLELRETLRRITLAVLHDEPVDEDALTSLNGFLAKDGPLTARREDGVDSRREDGANVRQEDGVNVRQEDGVNVRRKGGVDVSRKDGFGVEPPPTVEAALARIARQAATHLTGPELAHIRLCQDQECAGAYLDPTGRRRWCAADRCGVKNRVRAHRARQRTA